MTPSEIIAKGVEVCGSRTELATHLDVSTSSIDKWRKVGIPAKHCTVLFYLTGIPLYEMNPDVFSRELTLSEAWEVDIMYLLRHLKNLELLKDIRTMLEMETGHADPDTTDR
jgi:DNA-binding transcriptional regulator YdaS (Cro superfamily)